MTEETTISAALKSPLDWVQGRLMADRKEALMWQKLREELPATIINALHDAGYSIRKQGLRGNPKVTFTDATPYSTEIRVDLDVKPSIVGAIQRVEKYQLDERYVDHIGRHLSSVLADTIKKELIEPVWVDVMHSYKKYAAQGIEAQSATTAGRGPKDESPVA